MTPVEAIEHQVMRATPSELLKFQRWFSVFDADMWKTANTEETQSFKEEAEYKAFIDEKVKLLESSLKGNRAFTEEEFDFMVKHAGYNENYRSAFCNQDVVKTLNHFGGILDATELKFEELDEIIKETELKEKNAAGKN